LQGDGDPGDHVRSRQPPVQQQNVDQRPGARRVAVGFDRGGPERLVGHREHAGLAGLRQRGRARQRAGLAQQHLEIVVEDQRVGLLDHRPLVPGDLGAPVQDHQVRGAQHHPHGQADEPGRDRVVRLADSDQPEPVDLRGQQPTGLERLGGQRT
jgi:hypothetical protein